MIEQAIENLVAEIENYAENRVEQSWENFDLYENIKTLSFMPTDYEELKNDTDAFLSLFVVWHESPNMSKEKIYHINLFDQFSRWLEVRKNHKPDQKEILLMRKKINTFCEKIKKLLDDAIIEGKSND
jgi:hypothetical protein